MKKLLLLFSILLFTISSFGQTKVTTAVINFRSTPEMGNNIICRIPKGTEISLISGIIQCRHWIAIQYKGKIGFVYSTYLKQKPTQS